MGMIVSVYRHGKYDCTNGGISAKATELFVVNVEGPFNHDTLGEMPKVKLVKRKYGNVVLVPVDADEWATMWGGNFAYTSDSRFNQAVEKLSDYKFGFAVAIHDRIET